MPVTARLLPVDVRDDYWTERFAHAMGSTAHVVIGDAPDGLLDWAVDELERLEQCWSRFRADSELSQLNATAGEWVDVSASMLLALTCAADLFRATAGRFDPTIIGALEQAGYDRTFAAVAPVADGEPGGEQVPSSVPGWAGIAIDEPGMRVRLPAGTRIDLGGVGKGLAADLVAAGSSSAARVPRWPVSVATCAPAANPPRAGGRSRCCIRATTPSSRSSTRSTTARS